MDQLGEETEARVRNSTGGVLARPIVLIPHLFWLADVINFRKDYSPPSSPPSRPYTRHSPRGVADFPHL